MIPSTFNNPGSNIFLGPYAGNHLTGREDHVFILVTPIDATNTLYEFSTIITETEFQIISKVLQRARQRKRVLPV